MTNQIAIALGLVILGLFGLDAIVFDWSNSVFLGKKFAEFLEWIAFWR